VKAGMPEAKAREEALREVKQTMSSPLTGNQRFKVENQIQQYQESIGTIDKQLEVLHKYAFAAGAPGAAMRVKERVSNIFGSNQTDRVQVMRDLEYLKLPASRLLLDTQGRPLSAEHAQVNNIVAGMSLGDTTANTMRALKDLKARYERLMHGNQERLGEKPGQAEQGTVPSAPAVP